MGCESIRACQGNVRCVDGQWRRCSSTAEAYKWGFLYILPNRKRISHVQSMHPPHEHNPVRVTNPWRGSCEPLLLTTMFI